MPRRREHSSLDDLLDLLKLTPIWVGPMLAVIAFCLFGFLLPAFFPQKANGFDAGSFLRPMLPVFSWLAAGAVLVTWIMAEVWKLSNQRLLDRQSGIDSIRQLTWREFERTVAEAYRRKGYLAEVIGSGSGDGGVDIRLTGQDETTLVQCKHWKLYSVGVTTVRELLGVVTAEKATKGIIVTSGRFTNDARRFARHCGHIELVDGPELAVLVHQVRGAGQAPPLEQLPVQTTAPSPRCPSCGSEMVMRIARKGSNAGSQFWGCQKYPTCRGTRPFTKSLKPSGCTG